MRALVLRGFCIAVGKYAEIGQTVDLPDAFCLEMQRLGAVEPVPDEPAPAQAEPAAEVPSEDPTEQPAAPLAKPHKQRKGA